MKTLYESLLDSKEERSNKAVNGFLQPMIDYLKYSISTTFDDAFEIEVKNGKIYVKQVDRFGGYSCIDLHFSPFGQLNLSDIYADAELLKYCYFTNCCISIVIYDDVDLSFLNNCKNCNFIFYGTNYQSMDRNIILQFSKYMKKEKNCKLIIYGKLKDQSVLNNIDFGDNIIILDESFNLDIRGVKIDKLSFYKAVIYFNNEESQRFGCNKVFIWQLGRIKKIDPEMFNYIMNKFHENNPNIKYLYIKIKDGSINLFKEDGLYVYKDENTDKFTYKFVKNGDNPPRFN